VVGIALVHLALSGAAVIGGNLLNLLAAVFLSAVWHGCWALPFALFFATSRLPRSS
jgi:hypothetical protein